MKRKIKFETPTVLQAVGLSLEGGLLAQSVVENLTIKTTGQEVEEHDFSDATFNHEWGD